jgi:hypothetical protein
MRMRCSLVASDWERWLRIFSVVVGLAAAFCWLASSLVPLPLAPGAAIGGLAYCGRGRRNRRRGGAWPPL